MDYLILKLALSSTEGIECLPVSKLAENSKRVFEVMKEISVSEHQAITWGENNELS